MIHNIDWYNIYSRYSKQKKSLTSSGGMKNTQHKNYPDNYFLKNYKILTLQRNTYVNDLQKTNSHFNSVINCKSLLFFSPPFDC